MKNLNRSESYQRGYSPQPSERGWLNLRWLKRPAMIGLTAISLACLASLGRAVEATSEPGQILPSYCPLNPDGSIKFYQNPDRIGKPMFNPDPEKGLWGYSKDGYFYSVWLGPLGGNKINILGIKPEDWPKDIDLKARIFVDYPQALYPKGEQVWAVNRGSNNNIYVNIECKPQS